MAPSFRASTVLLALVASTGCNSTQAPCTEGCPNISGMYSLQDTTPLGECPFSPYLLPPTVQLEQSQDGRRVTLTVIDPSTQLEVPLTGDVYAPGPHDGAEAVGSFHIETRAARALSRNDDSLVTLDVSARGSVTLRDGRRMLSATLDTQDALSSESCLTTLSITGQGQ